MIPPTSAAAGVAESISVGVLDAFGNVAPGYSGTVSLTSSDPLAVLPASYTFAPTGDVTHTFTITLKTAAPVTITATDSTSRLAAGVLPGLVVAPGAAVSLVATAAKGATAGAAQALTVTMLDPFGNVASGYTGAVSFSSNDPRAGLPAGYTFTAADAGVHVFSATLKTAGNRSVTVSDTVNPC